VKRNSQPAAANALRVQCTRRRQARLRESYGLAPEAVRLQYLSRRLLALDGPRVLLMEVGCQPLASAASRRPHGRLVPIAHTFGPAMLVGFKSGRT
jgi:hypothetical protein